MTKKLLLRCFHQVYQNIITISSCCSIFCHTIFRLKFQINTVAVESLFRFKSYVNTDDSSDKNLVTLYFVSLRYSLLLYSFDKSSFHYQCTCISVCVFIVIHVNILIVYFPYSTILRNSLIERQPCNVKKYNFRTSYFVDLSNAIIRWRDTARTNRLYALKSQLRSWMSISRLYYSIPFFLLFHSLLFLSPVPVGATERIGKRRVAKVTYTLFIVLAYQRTSMEFF